MEISRKFTIANFLPRQRERKAGRRFSRPLGHPPCRGVFARFFPVPEPPSPRPDAPPRERAAVPVRPLSRSEVFFQTYAVLRMFSLFFPRFPRSSEVLLSERFSLVKFRFSLILRKRTRTPPDAPTGPRGPEAVLQRENSSVWSPRTRRRRGTTVRKKAPDARRSGAAGSPPSRGGAEMPVRGAMRDATTESDAGASDCA